MPFIYKIENKVNGKVYIGKTRRTDVTVRWDEHKNALNAGNHPNNHLQNAWKKYGSANFDFSIVSEYPVDYDEKKLADAEINYIDFFDSFRNGYNLTIASIGDEEPMFWKYTISKNGFRNSKQVYTILNRNGDPLIQSTNDKYLKPFLEILNLDEDLGIECIAKEKKFSYSISKNGIHYGKQQYSIFSREGKPLIQSYNKYLLEGLVFLLNFKEDEALNLISKIKEDNSISEETKLKISKSHKGKKLSKEHKENISKALKNKPRKEKEFFTVSKAGKSSNGKQKYKILGINNTTLISSVNKAFLDFAVDLINLNQDEWVEKVNGMLFLKNEKLLKELYKNYDCEGLV